MQTLSDQLRLAILKSSVSRYQIAKATGVSQSTLSKFVLRQRGISVEAMDAVAAYLNLQLVPSKRNRVSRSPKGG